MKVFAVNASPMMDKGSTAAILAPFLEGMEEAGAEIHVSYTKKLDIKPCQGEFSCQMKTPGKCFQKDDMQVLLPQLAEADVQVFATPVYVDGMAAPLKNLLDRMVPLGCPSFELRDGHCRHPLRDPKKGVKVVLVSTCGFWELDNFDPLLAHLRAFCRNFDREFAGALLRPHGPVFKAMAEKGAPLSDVIQAAKDAGRQLAADGAMRSETLAVVSRPLISLEDYLRGANQRRLVAKTGATKG
ncbi:MAG TPA: flavodoxin family protein [Spirochaetia bacterium]|nr:flavodoxin family protein [Spirochaetia bacterium]